MNHASRTARFLPLFAAMAIAACAAPGATVRSQAAPNAGFGGYQTFGFYDELPGQQAAYTSFVDQYVADAIAAEMQARGYRREVNGQLLINFHRQAREKVEVSQTTAPPGFYGHRRGLYTWAGAPVTTDVRTYREGTLLVDVVDGAAKKLLWQSVATQRVTEAIRENPKPVIDAAVARMFAEFPGRR